MSVPELKELAANKLQNTEWGLSIKELNREIRSKERSISMLRLSDSKTSMKRTKELRHEISNLKKEKRHILNSNLGGKVYSLGPGFEWV